MLLKTDSHQAKIFFDVWIFFDLFRLFYDLFCLHVRFRLVWMDLYALFHVFLINSHPQPSCGKVMFFKVSVILFTGGVWQTPPLGLHHPLGRHPPGRYLPGQILPWAYSSPGQTPPQQTPRAAHTPQADTHTPGRHTPLGRHPPGRHPSPQRTTTTEDGTHPTGNYSCFSIK